MNYYQPGVAPIGSETAVRPSPGVIFELRRAGFWASFLGWTTVVGMLSILALAVFVGLPGAGAGRVGQDVQAVEVSAADGLEGGVEMSGSAQLADQGLTVLGWISLLASLGMVVMLIWFGVATKRLLRFPIHQELHRVVVLQRRLWICIGIYCVCSILSLVLGMAGVFTAVSHMVPD